ncbi:MAG: DUF4266 domain-containing protein [Pseudomonadota bacterium]
MKKPITSLLQFTIVCASLALGGCTSTVNEFGESVSNFKLEPWVKPYERSNLADPIMAVGRNPIALTYAKHVHESREGARGASGSAGGGCGCN